MSMLRWDRLLEFLVRIETEMAMLWLGLVIFTTGLAILMYTRWGQYKPLRKCMAMSLLAHLLLASYAATVEIIPSIPLPAETITHVSLGDGPDENAAAGGSASQADKRNDQPWEVFPGDTFAQPVEVALERGAADPPPAPQRPDRAEDSKLPGDPAVEHMAIAEVKLLKPKAPAAQRREAAAGLMGLPDGPTDPMRLKPVERVASKVGADATYTVGDESADPSGNAVGPSDIGVGRRAAPSIAGLAGKPTGGGQGGADLLASNAPQFRLSGTAGNRASDAPPSVPDAYRLRVAPNRANVAQSRGGTAETEAAVMAALKWLADNQSADGRWNPRTHGAGKDANVLGRSRQGAGSRADTAVTGLALLAFLGSGHTHLDGPYRNDVRRGLEFLMQTQAPDGNLGGQAAVFEFMYCHAMATCSMSEAYGMTRDRRLRDPVRRAIGYTIAAQDPKGGGWRYRPGDAGDTSQLGWQLMSLKSAELAGISMPEQTRQGILRYLQSVSSGRYGGRASYRPGEQPTRPMTAEALVCWQFLGLAREHPACNEAADFLMGELPGEGIYNLYYWYYATLGMYQLQGNQWQRWNEALRTALVSRQVKQGPHAGSWDTNALWGGHGGRVYTTALGALTLEVYYRFLPLFAGSALAENHAK
jgi:hypothetical protein